MTGSACCKNMLRPAAQDVCAVSYYAVKALWCEGSYWYAYFYPHTERRLA